MKLSELQALINDPKLDPSAIVDDDTGMTVADLRKSLKENQAGFTKATQEAADLKRQLTTQTGQLEQLQGQLTQVNTYRQQLEAKAQETAGPDWRTDPLYAPLAKEFDRVTEVNRQLATAYVGLLQQYQTDRAAMFDWINKAEVDRIRSKPGFEDFDEAQVRETAKKYNVNDWEAAHKLWKAERVPDEIKAREEKARAEGMKAAEEKLKATPTELGTQPVVAGPVGSGDGKKSYSDAWKELVPEMAKLGGA